MAHTSSGVAGRYALALYDLADSAKALDSVADDLRGLKALIAESEDLNRLIRSPVIGREDQRKALDAVLDKAGANALTRKFVGTVATNRRQFALPEMAEAFLAELARRRGQVTAEVVSAKKLTEKQVNELTEALKKKLGAAVSLEQHIDESVIGGLLVKVGSQLIDSTLRTKLMRLELAMKGAE